MSACDAVVFDLHGTLVDEINFQPEVEKQRESLKQIARCRRQQVYGPLNRSVHGLLLWGWRTWPTIWSCSAIWLSSSWLGRLGWLGRGTLNPTLIILPY